MRGLEHAAARLHQAGADAKLFSLQYTRTTSFSHFWRHCDYADSIAAIATAGARFESMGAVMRNRPPLAAPLLMMLIVTVAVLWRALYAVAMACWELLSPVALATPLA